MKKHTAKELAKLPTIHRGQFDDLKVDDKPHKIWLRRVSKIVDGFEREVPGRFVTVEKLVKGKVSFETYYG